MVYYVVRVRVGVGKTGRATFLRTTAVRSRNEKLDTRASGYSLHRRRANLRSALRKSSHFRADDLSLSLSVSMSTWPMNTSPYAKWDAFKDEDASDREER